MNTASASAIAWRACWARDRDLPTLILGIWRLGAVYVPVFTAFAGDAVVDRVAASQARVLVTEVGQLPKTRDVAAVVMLAHDSAASDPRVPLQPQ